MLTTYFQSLRIVYMLTVAHLCILPGSDEFTKKIKELLNNYRITLCPDRQLCVTET